MTRQIKINVLTDALALYCRADYRPVLSIRFDGELCCGVIPRGTESMDTFHGLERVFSIPALKNHAAEQLMTHLVECGVVRRLLDSWDVYVDDQFNGRGRSDDDLALEVSWQIDQFCDGLDEFDMVFTPSLEEWSAGLGNLREQAEALGVTPETTDDQLDELADELRDLHEDGSPVDRLLGVEEHLRAIRRQLQDELAVVVGHGHSAAVEAVANGLPALLRRDQAEHRRRFDAEQDDAGWIGSLEPWDSDLEAAAAELGRPLTTEEVAVFVQAFRGRVACLLGVDW